MPEPPSRLPRVMRLSDVVLFNITAIVGLRWLTTAASQFGLASLVLWLIAMVVFFLPSAVAVRELADIDPGAGGIYRWVRRAYGPLRGFVAGWGHWVNNLFYFASLPVATAAIPAYACGCRGLVPANVDLPPINLFATMTFAFAGLELAPTLGDEIHDATVTLRRGIVISGFGIVVMYVLGTAAMLVALPAETVSITNGMPQATAALTQRIGAPWLAPVAAVLAILLALGNLGGVGAWLAGSARLPVVAGLDGALPPAFGRIHPRW